MFAVRFLPLDRVVNVAVGTPLLDVAAEAGIAIRTDCGAAGTCGKCTVLVKRPDGTESKRLACRTVVDSDMEITVPGFFSPIVVQLDSFQRAGDEAKRNPRTNSRYGVAFDIGTTTLAMELVDMTEPAQVIGVVGRANPQRPFGDDIISRIQAVVADPPKLQTMQRSIIDAANEMLRELARRAGINTDQVEKISVAGNTVMEYLFLGIDPTPLGFVPFTPPITTFSTRPAGELGLVMSPDGTVDVLPVLAGFVGGDLTAGILATEIYNSVHNKTIRQNGPILLIDIGTNGELVLWTGKELHVAATAAGPAFEGARIEMGTPAIPGAIERVTIFETGTVSVKTIGNRPAVGICGSGLIDAAAELLNRQLIKSNGRFNTATVSDHWTTANDKPAFRLDGRVYLSQRDIQQLQLAVGAIRAGTKILLQQSGIRFDELETLYVAGGFGSFIDPVHARRLGLLPPELPLEKIRFCGNTSLAGARRFLLTKRLFDVPVRHVELAKSPDFSNVFAESMIFPVSR